MWRLRHSAGRLCGLSVAGSGLLGIVCCYDHGRDVDAHCLGKKDWDDEVDFLVVGAGSSGCVVAARIAQAMPGSKTLLVEAGDTDDLEEIQTSVDYFGKAEKVFGSDRDWSYHAEAQGELKGRALYWPRGRVVGGCSSFNTMVYLRGDKQDYDGWRTMLGPGFEDWDYKGMLPFFKKAETHPGDASVHGKSGPMKVAPLSHESHSPGGAAHVVTRAFEWASSQLGEKLNSDFALFGNRGAGVNDVNASAGRRCSAASFLKMVHAYPQGLNTSSPNGALTVWLCTKATKLEFDDSRRCVGVELELGPRFSDQLSTSSQSKGKEEDSSSRQLAGQIVHSTRSGEKNKVRIRVKKEVVLCGGAVDSPRLLLLSGVGPRDHLEKVKVPVVADLPGVGANLRDHLHVPVCYRLPQGLKPHSHSNICEGTTFTKVDAKAPHTSDLQVHVGTIFFEPDGFSPLGEGFTLTPSLIHPRSMGSIRLVSNSPDDRPLIVANYLKERQDLDILVQGTKWVRALGSLMLDRLADSGVGRGAEIYPGDSVRSDREIEEYIRSFSGSMYHPACSARMGADDDPMAVLDSRLRVRGGVSNLRVIDASAMPEIIGSNTNATCIALGEKGAQMIVDDHVKKSV